MGPKSSGRQSAAIVYPITYRGHCRSYTSNGSSFGAGADSLYNPANDQIRHNRRESKAGVWVMYVYFHRSNLGYIVGSWRFAPLREKGWEEIWSGWSKRLSDRRGCPFSQCVCGPGLATGGVAWEERARWVDLGSRRRTLVSNLEFVSDLCTPTCVDLWLDPWAAPSTLKELRRGIWWLTGSPPHTGPLASCSDENIINNHVLNFFL